MELRLLHNLRKDQKGRSHCCAIVNWRDGDSTFYLRQRNATDLAEGDSAIDRVHTGGTSAAVWCLGEDTFCKAHAWCEGLELEANTIRSVQEKAPELPIPEVIYSRIDHPLGRTFLITKRVRGQTLERAWPQLSLAQRIQLATDVARFCTLLAANTSPRFETVSGCGVYEPRLMGDADPIHPTFRPRLLGPFTFDAMRAYMTTASANRPPELDQSFHLYHEDLRPTNIMISGDGNSVTGIIDWESAAYYPRFWVATKPVFAGAFWLECETDEPKLGGQLLGRELDANGFKEQEAIFREWRVG